METEPGKARLISPVPVVQDIFIAAMELMGIGAMVVEQYQTAMVMVVERGAAQVTPAICSVDMAIMDPSVTAQE